ncbi:MAG: fumarylacetoacetate hydrolase family protein [Hyphomicrobiales bacterium]
MRLVTFKRNGHTLPGLALEDGVADLTSKMGISSIRELLADGRMDEVRRIDMHIDYRWGDIELTIPIPDPQKIFCVGVNYMNRNEEYKDNSVAPKYPSLFMRSPMSFAGHEQSLVIPHESDQFDYEGEIVLVIGKQGRRISQDDAMDHVAGLTIMNEGSVRDWLRHGKFNVTQGKNFDCSGSIGPWIETNLAEINVEDMRIETHVNGELRQEDTTASMAFPFKRIIEYVSTFATLVPGDMIATGTPTGSGGRFDPPKWLKPGDIVDVTVEGVGKLRNSVVEEQA